MKEKPRYFVYVLRLGNGSLYTGCTRDIDARLRRHLEGSASRCTRSFPPVEIAACWEVSGGRGEAMSVEAFLKGRSRRQKELLVGTPGLLDRSYGEKTGRKLTVSPLSPLPALPAISRK
jgi:putative endonuclease